MIKKNVRDNVLAESCDIKSLSPVNPDFAGFAEVVDFYKSAFFEKIALDSRVKTEDLKLGLLGQ